MLKRSSMAALGLWGELGICLAACCMTAFFVAAFGDSWDNVKHQFLFNLLLDTCIVFLFAAALDTVHRRGRARAALGGIENVMAD